MPDKTILIAAHGTLGESELYCRAEFITGKSTSRAYSQDFLRVIANEDVIKPGALFAFIRSETAFRILRSASTGSKLQEFHYDVTPALPIPFPPDDIQVECHRLVLEAYQARESAIELEDQARTLVEQAIKQGGR